MFSHTAILQIRYRTVCKISIPLSTIVYVYVLYYSDLYASPHKKQEDTDGNKTAQDHTDGNKTAQDHTDGNKTAQDQALYSVREC